MSPRPQPTRGLATANSFRKMVGLKEAVWEQVKQDKLVGEFEERSTTKLDDYYYVLTRLGFSIDSCLLTFRNAPLSVNDVEYVAIRVLEPSDFHVASDVNIALSGHVRHIVVFESDALVLEFSHDTLYILADHPC